jgi:hypothetical protein
MKAESKKHINQLIERYDEDMLKMNGYDDCIIGVVERCGQPSVLCYDSEKVIKQTMKKDKINREEAEEWFYFNQIGAWVGEKTPCFLMR